MRQDRVIAADCVCALVQVVDADSYEDSKQEWQQRKPRVKPDQWQGDDKTNHAASERAIPQWKWGKFRHVPDDSPVFRWPAIVRLLVLALV